jgi:probable rRNA maturation factor
MTLPESLVLFRRAPIGLRRGELKEFAQRLLREVTGGRDFTCLITDDRELRRLNREFLQKDYPTDVLSFPSGDPDGAAGDIAISGERAAAQAAEFGHTIENELKILMLHGALHLLGMDHLSDGGEMRRAEKLLRKQLNLPAGLIERARA